MKLERLLKLYSTSGIWGGNKNSKSLSIRTSSPYYTTVNQSNQILKKKVFMFVLGNLHETSIFFAIP